MDENNHQVAKVIEAILHSEAATAQAELNILRKVEDMLDSVSGIMQAIQPGEQQIYLEGATEAEQLPEALIRSTAALNQEAFENFNKVGDSLSKVLRGMSDLVSESLKGIGDCKSARGRLIESLKVLVKQEPR